MTPDRTDDHRIAAELRHRQLRWSRMTWMRGATLLANHQPSRSAATFRDGSGSSRRGTWREQHTSCPKRLAFPDLQVVAIHGHPSHTH